MSSSDNEEPIAGPSTANEANLHAITNTGPAPWVAKPTERKTSACYGLKNTLHGDVFQLKLLMLGVIKGTVSNLKYQLLTERPDIGGQCEDVIFIYYNEIKNKWFYICIQAKHTLNEEKKITETKLLEDNKGPFSLAKYFRSMLDLKKHDDGNIDEDLKEGNYSDFHICTNIGFHQSLYSKTSPIRCIEISNSSDQHPLFDFKLSTKETVFYKLKITNKFCSELVEKWSEQNQLVNTLLEKKGSQLDLRNPVLKKYHWALVNKDIMKVEEKKDKKFFARFSENFISGKSLSDREKKLRKIMEEKMGDLNNCKWIASPTFGKEKTEEATDHPPASATEEEINEFFNKLVFVVNMPNEVELDGILKSHLGDHYNLLNNEVQFSFVLNKMLDWFKDTDKNNEIMDSEKGKAMLDDIKQKMGVISFTAVSNDYQDQLKNLVTFTELAIDGMEKTIKEMPQEKMVRLNTPDAKLTGTKVIATLARLEKYKRQDSYLVVPFKRLKEESFKERLKQLLEGEETRDSHYLLVIVCDGDELVDHDQVQSLENLIPDYEEGQRGEKKKGIIVAVGSEGQDEGEVKDDFSFNDLSDKESKEKLLNKRVSFQGKDVSVRDLVPENNPEYVIDGSSLTELIMKEKIIIPSMSADAIRFNKSLYISRSLNFPLPLYVHFLDQIVDEINKKRIQDKVSRDWLLNQLKIRSSGIQWKDSVDAKVKNEIWEAMKTVVKEIRNASSVGSITEDQLIQEDNRDRKVVIIAAVAGTGKSTILSNYYEKLKEKNPTDWVVRLDLLDHSKSIAEFDSNAKTAIDFFVGLHAVVGESFSSFARSLLRHRLKTGDGIVIMLDGFDEIDSNFQKKTTELITSIIENPVRLFVTARTHLIDELQNKLKQFAFDLKPFTEKDQIDYLRSFWENGLLEMLKTLAEEEKKNMVIDSLWEFAKTLVEKLSNSVNDREKEFLGIPLQCKMLAENFQADINGHIKESLENNPEGKIQFERLINEKTKFNLASLYNSFIETQRRMFCKDKAQLQPESNSNFYVTRGIDCLLQNIESHLTKVAIETLVVDKENVKVLWSTASSGKSQSQIKREEEKTIDDCISFGLIYKNGENSRGLFLHRTFAEYLFANFLYGGFHLDNDQYNGLLDTESARKLIANEILVGGQYECMRVFLDSMLKEIVETDKWNHNHGTETFPERLTKFENNIRSWGYIRAIQNRNSNLFVFLFDCLKSRSNQGKISEIVRSASIFEIGSSIFYEQSSRVFERVIKQCDVKNEEEVNLILERMLRDSPALRCDDWENNLTERKKVLELVLNFMQKAKENGTLNRFLDPESIRAKTNDVEVLHFLICQDGYEEHLKQYLQIFVRVYEKDEVTIDLVKNLLTYKMHFESIWDQDNNKRRRCYLSINKKLEKLIVLSELDQEEILEKMAHLILKRNPQLFDERYRSQIAIDEELPQNKKLLLNKDKYGMTILHRGVYRGNTEIVDQILNWVGDIHLNFGANPEDKKVAKEVVDYMAHHEDGFTPFHVAFACGNKELCKKIMEFLKTVLKDGELEKHLEDENGFLHLVLLEALYFEKIEMLEMIFNGIKNILGKLDFVFKSKNCKEKYIHHVFKKDCFKTIAEVVVDENINEGVDGYKKLNDLFFLDKSYAMHLLRNIELTVTWETLQKMLSVVGWETWVALVDDLDDGLKSICGMIEKNNIQLYSLCGELVEFVKSILESGESYSAGPEPPPFLAKNALFLGGSNSEPKLYQKIDKNNKQDKDKSYYFRYLPQLFQCISHSVSEDSLKSVLLYKESAPITRIILLNTFENSGSMYIYRLFYCLSDEYKKNLGEIIIKQAISMIPRLQSTGNRLKCGGLYLSNILPLLIDYATKDQLTQFVDIILTQHGLPDGTTCTIWSDYLSGDIFDNKELIDFLLCVSDKTGENVVTSLVLHDPATTETPLDTLLKKENIRRNWNQLIGGNLEKEKRTKLDAILKCRY